jgi:hypothetical protein
VCRKFVNDIGCRARSARHTMQHSQNLCYSLLPSFVCIGCLPPPCKGQHDEQETILPHFLEGSSVHFDSWLVIMGSGTWLKRSPPVPPLLAKSLPIGYVYILPQPSILHPYSNLGRVYSSSRGKDAPTSRKPARC